MWAIVDHPLQEYYPPETAAVRLGPGCFVGAGVTILPGAVVGEGSLVGAGSLVRDSVPPNSLAVGARGGSASPCIGTNVNYSNKQAELKIGKWESR